MTPASESAASAVLDLPNGTRLHLSSPLFLSNARFTAREIFEQKEYEHPGFELSPTDVVVDVGAHMGVFAHWAAPQIPQGRMVCVEPTAAAERFEYSLAQNHWDHVTLHRVALGRPSSTLEMIEHTTTAALSRNAAFQIALPFRIFLAWMKFRGRIVPTRRRTVPCWSLGELLCHERIEEVDLLKMDCEGSEYEILAHTEDGDLRRFRRIAMEYHLFHPTHRVETLVNRLQKCGFEVQVSQKWFDFWFAKVGMLFATRRD
jgi:FkbM family methyltransferase